MVTLDTNVWVRYLTNDDELQGRRALMLLEESDAVFVHKTVLLELEWVLSRVEYGFNEHRFELLLCQTR